MLLNENRSKDAERLLRFAMVITLCTGGISKFMSHGRFASYYGGLFRAPGLRIHLPEWWIDGFLETTPFIEIGIGLALLYTPWRRIALHAWCLFFISLEFGHYILEEWSPVNEMIPFIIMGALCLILPHHRSWFERIATED